MVLWGEPNGVVSTLALGAILTFLAWIGLMVAVIHGKYIVDKIAAGEYRKGPFSNSTDGSSTDGSSHE